MSYRWSLWLLSVAVIVAVAAVWLPAVLPTLSLLVVALLLLCASAVIALAGFPRHAGMPAPRWAWWTGAALIVGAIAADVFVTVWKSPGLEAEENLFAAALLDQVGLAPRSVYVLGGAAQLAVAAWMLALWRNLLARRGWYAESLRLARVQGRPVWLAMFGMRDGTLRSWLGEGARWDVLATAAGFYVPALAGYRAYLAMEWLGWVPYSRVLVPGALLLAAAVVHVRCVRRWSRMGTAGAAGEPMAAGREVSR